MGDVEAEAVDISLLATASLSSMGDLLRALELTVLEPVFLREEVDLKTIFYITDEQLVKLGLSLAQRVKVLRCVQILKDVPVNPRFQPHPISIRPKQTRPPVAAVPQNPTLVAPVSPPPLPAFKPRAVPQAAVSSVQRSPPRLTTTTPATGMRLESNMLAFIAYDSSSNLCLKHARLLEKSFDRDLGTDRVSLFACAVGLEEQASQEMFRFLNICSNSQDELLWCIFLGSSPEINSMVQPLVNVIFDSYPGCNAFFVLDGVQSRFADELAFPAVARGNPQLGFSLLTCSYPAPPNPLYLSLCLLDTMRGHVALLAQDNTISVSIDRFVDEAFANLEFLERCSDTAIQVNYLPGQEDDLVQRLVILSDVPSASLGNHQDKVGCRGICKDRPVQLVQSKGELILVRFLEEYSDPQYVGMDEITLDYDEEGEGDVPPPPDDEFPEWPTMEEEFDM
ncbi:hypothetical protein BASA81_008446 [Batrachochytrium salamandrivorans]|nr:hypothetical protein BASA81_008446 [Batrachochytrium salamandrivorans]